MALPVNCKIFFLLLSLLLIIPVSADLSNTSLEFSGEAPEQPSAPYTITLFIPTSTMVHSNQIMDQVSGTDNQVILATSFGLSTYSGTWITKHMTLGNISEGLMDDFITAVEYDRNGSLWIGSSKGIQVYDGRYYQVIRDAQLLKDTRIKDLQRWNDDMWVATGHSGIHRFRDGHWTWYQPESDGGPGFYEADSIAFDHSANATLIATEREGLWIIRSQEDPIVFECIADKGSSFGLLEHVRRDHRGGVYFFNDSTVIHYTPGVNFTPVLTNRDLSITPRQINDLAAAPDGKLYLATDGGIYIWKEGAVFLHLDRFEGIGTSSVVQTIFIDTLERVWFSTPDNIGYYIDHSDSQNSLAVQFVTPTPLSENSQIPVPNLEVSPETVTTSISAISRDMSQGNLFSGLDPIIRAIRSFFTGIGLKPRF